MANNDGRRLREMHGTMGGNRFKAVMGSSDLVRAPWDRITDETVSFVAFPSLGAMVPGWLLVVPRRAILSLRELTAEEFTELDAFVEHLRTRLRPFGGRVQLFEHGNSTANGPVGCGVDQAHLHVVPLPFDLIDAAIASRDTNISWTERHGAVSFASVIPPCGEYVGLLRPDDGLGLAGVMTDPASQWVRRLVAERLGRGSAWDYRTNPDLSNLLRTVEVLTTA